jgi:hypothetical protein
MTQHHEEHATPTAPGPAIQPHVNPLAAEPIGHAQAMEAKTPTAPNNVQHQHAQPIAEHTPQPQQVQRHEISVQRPEQKLPLTPSHEGWVRRAPPESAPHPEPHNEPQHGAAPADHPEHAGQDGEHNHP